MSARDDLYMLAIDDMPVGPDDVLSAIDAYAHELAEQIRADTYFDSFYHSWVADLIDPEVGNHE